MMETLRFSYILFDEIWLDIGKKTSRNGVKNVGIGQAIDDLRSMFLTLNHKKLDIYNASREFVSECYKLSRILPEDERFGMRSQIRRAALSVHLNIAEGASRKSPHERKRFYEVARGSLIEVDAAIDIANDLEYLKNYSTEKFGNAMILCFKILCGMIK